MEENQTKKKVKLWERHPVIFLCCRDIEATIVVLVFTIVCLNFLANGFSDLRFAALEFIGGLLFALLAVHLPIIPVVLIVVNIALIFIKPQDDRSWKMKARCFEIVSAVVGFILTEMVINSFVLSVVSADWNTQIAWDERHSPIWIRSIPTAVTLLLIGVAGYLTLGFTHAKKTPPLVTVLGISALYIGVFECVIWCVQVCNMNFLLAILPINCIVIAARLIREKALELKTGRKEEFTYKSGFIGWFNQELASGRFPVWALTLAFPLLGLAIGVLVLFGQRPDDIIKGYTETADWVLSQRIAPPSSSPSHYLCTVAAQGHRKLVKPQRVGIRHGRKTIVNRQLCIANAFEQILEERLPQLHKAVRKFYDAYGFPISKLIKTKAAADFVYVVMKPLEWIFLAVLYLFTINPEERIARQYRA